MAALRNGTIGWLLAGQTLDKGQQRRFREPDAVSEDQARTSARAIADRAGVRRLNLASLAVLARDGSRTLYRFDVRTPEEYAAGHPASFRCAPGGQLVQETDHVATVRGARIVLADPRGVRADMTASWLAQMGWEVYVLDGDTGPLQTGPWQAQTPPVPSVPMISAAELAERQDQTLVIDLAPSPAYRRGHIPGAWFAIRARLAEATDRLRAAPAIVLISPDDVLARFAAADLAALGLPVTVLEGGTAAWIAAGRPLEKDLPRALTATADVYRRPYEGVDNAAAAMQAYLDWEFGLVAQLDRDASHFFFVL